MGQYDLFVLFIELGLNLGKINSMIVPKPILNNENYKVARSLLLNSCIASIVTGSNIFENAGVESCIFLTNRGTEESTINISKYEQHSFIQTNHITRDIYRQSSSMIFSTEIGSGEIELLSKLNSFDKFEQFFNVKRGVEAGKKDESILDYDNGYALLRGQDVSKFSIAHCGKYIDFDEYDISKYKELSLYLNPKILLRRVGNTIQCVYDDESFIVLNTIYCITFKRNNLGSLEAFSAILNSKLVAFWFFKTFCNTDKLFPYIRVSQLEKIPIPKLNAEADKELKDLASDVKNRPNPLILSKIDLLVYHLYSLTYDEVLIIDPETSITREEYEDESEML